GVQTCALPIYLEVAGIYSQGVFFSRGSTAELQAFAHRSADPSDHGKLLYMQGLNAALRGDWAEFARIYREQPYFDGNPDDPRWSQEVNAAENFAEAGDMEMARTLATEAIGLMKAELVRQAESPQLWASLSLRHA